MGIQPQSRGSQEKTTKPSSNTPEIISKNSTKSMHPGTDGKYVTHSKQPLHWLNTMRAKTRRSTIFHSLSRRHSQRTNSCRSPRLPSTSISTSKRLSGQRRLLQGKLRNEGTTSTRTISPRNQRRKRQRRKGLAPPGIRKDRGQIEGMMDQYLASLTMFRQDPLQSCECDPDLTILGSFRAFMTLRRSRRYNALEMSYMISSKC